MKSLGDMAEFLGVTERHVRNLVRDKKLPRPRRTIGGKIAGWEDAAFAAFQSLGMASDPQRLLEQYVALYDLIREDFMRVRDDDQAPLESRRFAELAVMLLTDVYVDLEVRAEIGISLAATLAETIGHTPEDLLRIATRSDQLLRVLEQHSKVRTKGVPMSPKAAAEVVFRAVDRTRDDAERKLLLEVVSLLTEPPGREELLRAICNVNIFNNAMLDRLQPEDEE